MRKNYDVYIIQILSSNEMEFMLKALIMFTNF